MNNEEFYLLCYDRINKILTVLYDLSAYNISLFANEILPLRFNDTIKYWKLINAWCDRLQKGEVDSNKTK